MIFLIFALTILFFFKIFLHPNQMIYPGYDLGIYSAWKLFFAQGFHELGKFPLWNPYLFSGSSFIGSGQSAMFYPINIAYLFLPVENAFSYIFILDFFLIGLFTYLYCRIIKLNSFSSLIAAICMEFSGVISSRLFYGHIFILDGIVWFPLILLFFELSIQRNRYIYGILASIPIGLMFLSGSAQIIAYGYLASILYFVIRYLSEYMFAQKKVFKFKILSAPIIALLLGLSLSAIQLLPGNELSKLSIRSSGLDLEFASSIFLSPKQLISFILPNFFGSPFNATYWGKGNFIESCGYIGVFPLVLTLISLKFLSKNKYIFPFIFLAIFSLFFSFGNSSFLSPLFHNYVPIFNLFRVPSRFLYIYSFSISILTGIGTEYIFVNKLLRKTKVFLKKINFFIFIFLLATLILLIFLLVDKNSFSDYEKYILKNSYAVGINHKLVFLQTINDLYYFCASLIITIFVIILLSKKSGFVGLAKIMSISFIFASLFLFGSTFYSTNDIARVFNTPSEISFIKKDSEIARVFDMSGYFVYFLPRNNIQSATGYDAIYLKSYRDFLWNAGGHVNSPYESFFQFKSVTNLSVLKMLNVKYILSKNFIDNSELKLLYKNSYYLYQLNDYLPRAYLTGNAIVISDRQELLNVVTDAKFDYKNSIILEKKTGYPLNNASTFIPVPIKDYASDKIDLNVKLQQPGYLTLSEIWYPGWKAYVNNKETEIMRSNYLFRSIYLSEGENKVEFIYKPNSYEFGKNITKISIVFIVVILLLELSRHIRSKP